LNIKRKKVKKIMKKAAKKAMVVICIPTKNEEENVELIAGKILKTRIPKQIALKDLQSNKLKIIQTISLKILFINDHSTDSTFKIEKKLQERDKGKIFVINNKRKPGIGNAYITGFEFAIKRLHADFIIEMDADLSHDPKDLPLLLKGLEDSDVVLGSRYIERGKIIGWPARRRIISALANLVSYPATGLKVKDVTTGYRAYRREVLETIDYKSGKGFGGYAFQLKMVCEAVKHNFLIREIPIVFRNRKLGSSKLSSKDIFEFFILASKETLEKIKENKR